MAELGRLFHSVSADEAHRIVDGLVRRVAPIVQDFDGALKVLNPALGASDHCLVLLYHCGEAGATFEQLGSWVRPRMRAYLGLTLNRMSDDRGLLHFDGVRYRITHLGEREVEERRLVET